MAAKGQAYVPSMGDEAVRAKTDKDWKGWLNSSKRDIDKLGFKCNYIFPHGQKLKLIWRDPRPS
jgi:hypothetical protein